MNIFLELFLALGLLVLVGLVWGFLQRNINERSSLAGKYAYVLKKSVLRPEELQYYRVLAQSIRPEQVVVPQAHLSVFLSPAHDGQFEQAAFRHISQKSVDFLICDRDSLAPQIAVELDGKSHQSEERRLRDDEVERIFQDAKLPLLRVSRSASYTVDETKRQLAVALSTKRL